MKSELYSEIRAAQVAAFFLYKAGGRMSILKLMKLMYLAERLSLKKYGEPVTGDRLVSMPYGPVLSHTLNHINGLLPSSKGGWDDWISDKENREVALCDPSMLRSPEQDLLALSESDLEVLNDIWEQFGHLSKWQLVDYTHSGACPEWKDPGRSSFPITYMDLFKAFDFSHDASQELSDRLEIQRYLNRLLA